MPGSTTLGRSTWIEGRERQRVNAGQRPGQDPVHSPQSPPAVLGITVRSAHHRHPHCSPSTPVSQPKVGNCTPRPRRLNPTSRRYDPLLAASIRPPAVARRLAARRNRTPGRSPQSSMSLPQVAASLPAPPDTRGADYACSPGSSHCRYMLPISGKNVAVLSSAVNEVWRLHLRIVFSCAYFVLKCIQYFIDPNLSLMRNSTCE
jgi:hypothetical protein